MRTSFEELVNAVKSQPAKQLDVVELPERKQRTKEEKMADIKRLGLKLIQGGKV